MIVAGGDGFPKIVSSLRKVPGIGDYTAGAIASIAFKEVSSFHGFALINKESQLFKKNNIRLFQW